MEATNLLELQNLIKRDPHAYRDEFLQQYRHFLSTMEIFKMHPPNKDTKRFCELVTFIAHVSPKFQNDCQAVPLQLLGLLDAHYESLESSLRRTLAQALILLGNRDCVSRAELLPVFFRLFRCEDKLLRQLLFTHIVQDIQRVNMPTTALPKGQSRAKLNGQLQAFMYTMLKDESVIAAKKSLDVMVELWRRRVWTDAKTVNAIATACFSKDTKVLVAALHFFIGVELRDEKEMKQQRSSSDNTQLTMRELVIRASATKSFGGGKKKQRKIRRAMEKLHQEERDDDKHSSIRIDSSAIRLLYDPQSFSERLYRHLCASNQAFEVRLLMVNVLSRLVGFHKLLLYELHTYIQRYLNPHQRHVTQLLAFLAQSTHSLVPPEILQPCVLTLANRFVTDRSSPEIMTVGLNALREICARCPLVMTRELLVDLAQYKKSKHKGVMMAARSLIALFRDVNPSLLVKRDRGRAGAELARSGAQLEFGATAVDSDVAGAELLREDEANVDGDGADAWDEAKERFEGSDDDELGSDGELDDDEDEMPSDVSVEMDSDNDDDDDDDDGDDDDDDDDRKEGEKEEKKTKKARRGRGPKRTTADSVEVNEVKEVKAPAPRLAARTARRTSRVADVDGDVELEAEKGGADDGDSGEDAKEEANDADEARGDDVEEEDGAAVNEDDVDDDDDDGDDDGDEEEEEDADDNEEDGDEGEEDFDEEEENDDGFVDEEGEDKEGERQEGGNELDQREADAPAQDKLKPAKQPPIEEQQRPSLPFAATTILTPAHLALINKRRAMLLTGQRGGRAAKAAADSETKAVGRFSESARDGHTAATLQKQKRRVDALYGGVGDAVVPEDVISGAGLIRERPNKRSKADRLESAHEGSVAARLDRATEKKGGTTNAEKRKHKNFGMMKHADHVLGKGTESLHQKRRRATKHAQTLKKANKRVQRSLNRRSANKRR